MIERSTDTTKANGFCYHGNRASACPTCVADQKKKGVEPENKEYSGEEIESFFEAAFMVANMINEGKEGIIAVIDVNKLPLPAREYLIGDVDVPEIHALKMLKVYKPGAGKREFDAHKKIYDLLHDKEGVARVPKPYNYKKLPIKTDAARKKIADGFHVDPPPSHADIILMDLIDGKDLASLMHRFVVAHHSESQPHDKGRTNNMNDAEAQRIAQYLLHFRDEKVLEDGTPTTQAQREATLTANESNMDEWLAKNGFTLPNTIRLAITGALTHMHDAGIYHRDLHRRNVMVGNDGTVFLIDFGKTHVAGRDKKYGQDIYSGTEGEYLHDDGILRLLRSFESKPKRPELSLSQEAEDTLRQLDAGKKNLEDAPTTERGKAWAALAQIIADRGATMTVEELQSHIEQLARVLPSPLIRGLAALELAAYQPLIARDYIARQLDAEDVKTQKHILEKIGHLKEIINALQRES